MDKVSLGKFNFESEEWENVSQGAKNFIKKLLEKDVTKRYSAEDALQDPWLINTAKSEVNVPLLTNCLKNMQNFRV